jgi:predicted nuclease of predicted toxin-antitoxin system
MKVRFQADADLNQVIVAATLRRAAEIDFRTASLAGLAHLEDLDVLAVAAREGRVLVTHDSKTMPRHFADFVASQESPGVIIVPQHLDAAWVLSARRSRSSVDVTGLPLSLRAVPRE